MALKIVGYIATCEGHGMFLVKDWPDAPSGGTLAYSNKVTMFEDYRQARAAILRTIRYAKRNNLPWPILEKGARVEKLVAA